MSLRTRLHSRRLWAIVAGAIALAVVAVIGVQAWANPEPMVLPGTVYDIDEPITVTDDLLVGMVKDANPTEPGRLRAVGLDDGSTVWERRMDGSTAAVESGVLVLAHKQQWAGLDLSTGRQLWTVRSPWTEDSDVDVRLRFVDTGAVVITRSQERTLDRGFGAFALDVRTGQRLWSTSDFVFTGGWRMGDRARVVRTSRLLEDRGRDEPLIVRESRSGRTVATLPPSYAASLMGQDLVAATDPAGDELSARSIETGKTIWTHDREHYFDLVGSSSSTMCTFPSSLVLDATTGRSIDPPPPWTVEESAGAFGCAPWAVVVHGEAVALWRIGTPTVDALPDYTDFDSFGRHLHGSIVVNGEQVAVVVGPVRDLLGDWVSQTDVWFDGSHSVWRSEPLLAAGGFGDSSTLPRPSSPAVSSLWTDHGYLAFHAKDGTRLVDLEP